jgi:hypothetical protein
MQIEKQEKISHIEIFRVLNFTKHSIISGNGKWNFQSKFYNLFFHLTIGLDFPPHNPPGRIEQTTSVTAGGDGVMTKVVRPSGVTCVRFSDLPCCRVRVFVSGFLLSLTCSGFVVAMAWNIYRNRHSEM